MRDESAISQDFAFNLDHPADSSGHSRARLEQLIRSRATRKLERSECGNAQEAGAAWAFVARRCETTGLCHEFHEDDRRNYRVPGKVPLKVPVVRVSNPQTPGRLPRDEIRNLFD